MNTRYFRMFLMICLSYASISYAVYAIKPGTNNYYKQPNAPTHLYVIDAAGLTAAEETMIVSLQGIVARTKPEIYLLSNMNPESRASYQEWLDDLVNNHGITTTTESDPWALVALFQSHISGYVLADFENDSLNAATNLANVHGAIIVEDSIKATADAKGYLMMADATDKTEQWVFDNYWSFFAHDAAIEQPDEWDSANSQIKWGAHATLRDYALFAKQFVYFQTAESASQDYPLRLEILAALEDDSPVHGYGDYETLGEDGFIGTLSLNGNFTTANNHALNLSVLAGINTGAVSQNTHQPTFTAQTGKHYVTLIWSDGDNAQWPLGFMSTQNDANSKQVADDFSWWANQHRGEWSMGWGLSSSMIGTAPSVVKWYYDNATNNNVKDGFVLYGTGGYMYPSLYPVAEMQKNAVRMNEYLNKLDVGELVVIDKDAINNLALWDNYTAQAHLNGIFYLDYSNYHKYNGQINWSNDKPIISARYTLWNGILNEAQIASGINNASNDITSANAYSMISVHAWSKNMYDVKALVDSFGPNVEVVTPEVFVKLVTENVVHATVPTVPTPGTIFHDNFDDGTSDGWSTSDGTWAVVANKYHGTANPGVQSYALAGNTVWTDYTYSVDVTIREEGGQDVGIAFRAADADNHYLLAIRAVNSELYKRVGGLYTSLGLISTPNALNTQYKYIVSMIGSTIKITRDTVVQATIIDSTFSSGKIGLRTAGSSQADFDEVKVTDNTLPFNDNFDDLTSDGWVSSNGTWSASTGAYTAIANVGAQSYSLVGNTAWTDYNFKVGVTMASASADTGLAFRAQDVSNHYLLAIRAWGIELYKRENGNYTSLAVAAGASTLGVSYDYKVLVFGDTISIQKDGTTLIGVTDSTFDHGGIGLRHASQDTVVFDDISVF